MDLNEEYDYLLDETESHNRMDCQCQLCTRFREIDATPPALWTGAIFPLRGDHSKHR